jgi:NAD(P)-dependent dehydrogenase (short-subunit alcohol dehydrogenase family)
VLTNLEKEEDVQRLFISTIEAFGHLDIIVNNGFTTPFYIDVDENVFSTDFGHLNSIVQLIKLSIPYLSKSKETIINVSSITSIKPVLH